MATSMARMRFNATRFISIAALQSIAASSRQGRRHYRRGGRGGDKIPRIFLCGRFSRHDRLPFEWVFDTCEALSGSVRFRVAPGLFCRSSLLHLERARTTQNVGCLDDRYWN
jgi:hypothetical protein